MTPNESQGRGAKVWLRQRARQMRKEMTAQERAMWSILHDGELVALNWRRQAPLGDYVLDFVSHPARLVVEVDGSQHAQTENRQHDDKRSAWLNTQGYRVLRFWNADAMKEKEAIWQMIYAAASATSAAPRMKRWRAANTESRNAQINLLLDGGGDREAVGGGARASDDGVASNGRPSTSAGLTSSVSRCAPDSSSIEEEQ